MNHDAASLWNRYQTHLIRFDDAPLRFSLDVSRMKFDPAWLESMEPHCRQALDELDRLEAGAPVNQDEDRMVGHYWLRNPSLAPTEDLQASIRSEIASAHDFARRVHHGEISPEHGGTFRNLLIVGIGGSALGPQLVQDALAGPAAPLRTFFLDNTDPQGIDRVFAEIGPEGLAHTLTIVTSKSGGTPETRNGMLEARRAYEAAGLTFARHAVAITGVDSQLDQIALHDGWIHRFPMADWVGGRTSVMSLVGLVPAALQGVDIDAFLAGAAAMDAKTRAPQTRINPALMLALMWHYAGNGAGERDMVVLPYKDRLLLFSRYLQQLVMESLGKEFKRGNQVRVNQGIAVYGNKGSTDQHAYVQQLRDGRNNFFVVFIEVATERDTPRFVVDRSTDASAGDYLQGFLRGTRSALFDKDRESITLSIPTVDAFHLGALIALFERAVTFYASFIDVNAYHQPGVEAGKKAAGVFLHSLHAVRQQLAAEPGSTHTADSLALSLGQDSETVFHSLNHLAANGIARVQRGPTPAQDEFQVVS